MLGKAQSSYVDNEPKFTERRLQQDAREPVPSHQGQASSQCRLENNVPPLSEQATAACLEARKRLPFESRAPSASQYSHKNGTYSYYSVYCFLPVILNAPMPCLWRRYLHRHTPRPSHAWQSTEKPQAAASRFQVQQGMQVSLQSPLYAY